MLHKLNAVGTCELDDLPEDMSVINARLFGKGLPLLMDDTLDATHAANNCVQSPLMSIPDVATSSINNAHMFAQQTGQNINKWWLLLDSQASVNVMANPAMVLNIWKHPSKKSVRLHCNAGSVDVDVIADMPGCGTMWHCLDGIANILSSVLVSDTFRVTLDTVIDQAFHVCHNNGSSR